MLFVMAWDEGHLNLWITLDAIKFILWYSIG